MVLLRIQAKNAFFSHKIALSSILYYIYKKIKGDIFGGN